MEFIDLKAQRDRIRDKLESNIQAVLDHCRFIMGPEVFELEKKLASFVGVKHAISCGSGTDALLMALMAYGVGPGDVILTTPFSFASTAEVIGLLGATTVFVEIEPDSYNISPEKLDRCIRVINGEIAPEGRHPFPTLSSRPDHKIKGVISVDIFGLPADFDPIRKIADDHGLFLIEDAAQSFGAVYKDKKACSMGDIACTSFFPAKPLGCYGDGGMCFTDDDAWADVLQSVRIHGKGSDKYDNVRIGINGRMDTLQAAVLLAKFDIFPEEIEKRQSVAKRYTDLLTEKCPSIVPPKVPEGSLSAWAQYSLLTKSPEHRTAVQSKLKEIGVPTAIYYPLPLHLQTAYRDLGHIKGDFPVSEDCSQRIMSLPMHPYLREEDQERIVECIRTVE